MSWDKIVAWFKAFVGKVEDIEAEVEKEISGFATMKLKLAEKIEKAKDLHQKADAEIVKRTEELEAKKREIEEAIQAELGKQTVMTKVQKRCSTIITNIETFLAEVDDDEEQAA